MKPKRQFSMLIKALKDKNAPQVMAEKQSPQAPSTTPMSPDETAEEIVNKRNQLKKGQMPSNTNGLYDEL